MHIQHDRDLEYCVKKLILTVLVRFLDKSEAFDGVTIIIIIIIIIIILH